MNGACFSRAQFSGQKSVANVKRAMDSKESREGDGKVGWLPGGEDTSVQP